MKKLKSLLSVALSVAAGAGALTLSAPETQAQNVCQVDNTFCDSMNADSCHYVQYMTCEINQREDGTFSCISTYCGPIPNG